MAKTPNEIGRPATPVVKPNQPIPAGARVERRDAGGVNSPNTGAGGEVPVDRYSEQSK
jgi:hypothetical protein